MALGTIAYQASIHGIFQAKILVLSYFLFPGDLLTQESNPSLLSHLLCCSRLPLSHQANQDGSFSILEPRKFSITILWCPDPVDPVSLATTSLPGPWDTDAPTQSLRPRLMCPSASALPILLPASTLYPWSWPRASPGRIHPKAALAPGQISPILTPIQHPHSAASSAHQELFPALHSTITASFQPGPKYRPGPERGFDSVDKYTEEKEERRQDERDREDRAGRKGLQLSRVGLKHGPSCATRASGASPSFPRPLPGSWYCIQSSLDEAQLCSLYSPFPILYIIKISFSILFSFSFYLESENTEETIFIGLRRTCVEVVWRRKAWREKGLFHPGDFAVCKGALPG